MWNIPHVLTAPLRHAAGGEPVARLNARLEDASESSPTRVAIS